MRSCEVSEGGIMCAERDRRNERAIWVRHLILFLFFRNDFHFSDTCKNYCGGNYVKYRPSYSIKMNGRDRVKQNCGDCQNPSPSVFALLISEICRIAGYASNYPAQNLIIPIRIICERPKEHYDSNNFYNRYCLNFLFHRDNIKCRTSYTLLCDVPYI